jgi:hypothetical protein
MTSSSRNLDGNVALHAHCMQTQDSEVMRKAWSEAQVTYRTSTDVLLPYYFQTLGSHLLMSIAQLDQTS